MYITMNTTLHIPVNKIIKTKAEAAVKTQGYSSLQEIIRVFLSSLARGEVKTTFTSSDIELLTESQEMHLNKREEQTLTAIKKGKAYSVRTAAEMIDTLEKPLKI